VRGGLGLGNGELAFIGTLSLTPPFFLSSSASTSAGAGARTLALKRKSFQYIYYIFIK